METGASSLIALVYTLVGLHASRINSRIALLNLEVYDFLSQKSRKKLPVKNKKPAILFNQ